MKKRISKAEQEKIYAALKLIENLYKQGRIGKHIFKNILNEYSNRVDAETFMC